MRQNAKRQKDNIRIYKGLDLPEPIYEGFELKKDLTMKKNGNSVAIYGNHGITLVKAV